MCVYVHVNTNISPTHPYVRACVRVCLGMRITPKCRPYTCSQSDLPPSPRAQRPACTPNSESVRR